MFKRIDIIIAEILGLGLKCGEWLWVDTAKNWMFIKVNFIYLFFEWDSAGSENNLRRKRVPDRDYTMREKMFLNVWFC